MHVCIYNLTNTHSFVNFMIDCFFLIAYPDVIVKDLTPDHEFLVLACDGIWDVMTNDEVVDFVRTRIASRMEPEQVSYFILCIILFNI